MYDKRSIRTRLFKGTVTFFTDYLLYLLTRLKEAGCSNLYNVPTLPRLLLREFFRDGIFDDRCFALEKCQDYSVEILPVAFRIYDDVALCFASALLCTNVTYVPVR